MQDTKTSFDIIFVSAFGRHHWLAKELAASEWRVGHIDVTKLLGQWGEQDVKNPFGLSKVPDLNPEQLQSWQTMTKAIKVENGLSILLNEGPFEGSGPLKDFFKTRFSSHQVGSFDDTWRSGLTKQLASSVYLDNFKAHELSTEIPVSDEILKDLSTPDSRHSQKFFKDVPHVQNFEPARFSSIEKAQDGHFELVIETPYQGESKSNAYEPRKMRSRVLVWALTSAETEFLSHELMPFLFFSKIVDPAWSWQRFSYVGPAEVLERWPTQFYLLGHLRMPWTHDNLCLISKRDSSRNEVSRFDVWMRVPTIFRFNSNYHFALGHQLQIKLNERFVAKDFELVDLPIESNLAKEKLGPPRWPVYLFEDQPKALKNPYLIFESCEILKTHQAQASLRFQADLYANLEVLRKQWLAVEARAQQKTINREINMRE